MFDKKRYSAIFPIVVVAVSLVLLVAGGADAQGRQWQEHNQSVILKTKEFQYKFSYPQDWFLSTPDPIYVSVQNVAPADAREYDLPEGFVKVGFMLDPKADPGNLLHGDGESLTLNDITWRRMLRSGEAAGDASMTFETVRAGVVFRVYAYIARTGGSGLLFNRQVETINRIVASLRIEPVIQHETIPGAPAFPPDGKPEATPIGSPRVP